MDVSWISVVAATGCALIGAAALVYSLRRSGDSLEADPAAVRRAVERIDEKRLSNVLTRVLPTRG